MMCVFVGGPLNGKVRDVGPSPPFNIQIPQIQQDPAAMVAFRLHDCLEVREVRAMIGRQYYVTDMDKPHVVHVAYYLHRAIIRGIETFVYSTETAETDESLSQKISGSISR